MFRFSRSVNTEMYVCRQPIKQACEVGCDCRSVGDVDNIFKFPAMWIGTIFKWYITNQSELKNFWCFKLSKRFFLF